MTFIRFPASLQSHIKDSLKFFNPDLKVSFMEFIDPNTQEHLVDMEYSTEDIPEDRVQDIINWIKKKSQEEPKSITFNEYLAEDQLDLVVHVHHSIGHTQYKIEVTTHPFMTRITLL